MTDIHTRDEHQVVDLTAARAAKGLITAEMFKAAGVAATAPPAPDGLVPHQPTSKAEILRLGAEAMDRLTKSRSWDDWKFRNGRGRHRPHVRDA